MSEADCPSRALRRGVSIALLLAPLVTGACRNDRSIALAEASSAGTTSKSAWTPERVAELWFSTGVSGYVEPCGCTSKPLGGIQRLATVLRRGHQHRALIDAGDLLFPKEGLDDLAADQHRLKARLLARMYRQLGAVALNLGPADLSGGAELLKELQREGAVPFVSANIRPVGDAGPAVKQSFIREIGGIRVGFSGVATPEKLASVKGITAIEYAPALRSEVMHLRRSGAEVVVVLAHVGESGAKDLAQAVPDIDVIVRAPGTPIGEKPLAPQRAGNVIIVEAGSQGQHVGKLTLRFDRQPPSRPIALDDGGEQARRSRELTERKIRAYRREAQSWRADPGKKAAVEAKEAQIARLEASLAQTAPERAQSPSAPHIAVELIALTEDIPSDGQASELLSVYYAQLKDLNLAKGDVEKCAPKKDAATYVGTSECIDCHTEAYEFWQKTKHAKAWATLEQSNKHFDLTCVGCHTIGFQEPGGFCRLKDVGELKDVGCENCHGPGSVHVESQESSDIRLAVTEATCAGSCHVPEHSDTFEYEPYLLKITGEGHRLRSLKP